MPIKTPTDIIADACQAVYSYRAPQVGTAEHIIEALGKAGFEIVEKEAQVRIVETPRLAGGEPDAYRERWENGFRNIVQILHGGSYSFDIPDIIEEVRALKAATRPGEPIRIKLPDGSIHGYYRDGGVLKPGTVALLTPEGERLVDAVAKGDLSRLSMGAYASLHELKERLVVPDIGSLVAGYVEPPLTPGELKDLLTPEDFTGPVTLEKGAEATLPPGTQIHIGHTRGHDAQSSDHRIWKAIRDCFEASRLTYAAAQVIGHAAVSEILNSAEPPVADDEEAA